MKDLPEIKALLDDSKEIVITMHANPDADALGSSLGLFHYLKSQGYNVTVVAPTSYPDFLNWMPRNEEVEVFDPSIETSTIDKADLIFCLDFSGLKRVKDMHNSLKNSAAKKVIIDHHQNPEDFADAMIWDTKAAATAELIFLMIEEMSGLDSITRDVAACLYAGIMTDTGSFRHSNTTPRVHRIVADLMERGANGAEISNAIYDTNSLNRLRFLGYALKELLEVDMRRGVAFFAISERDAKRFNLQQGDTEGLVNYALSVDGIVAAALFKEADGEIKISFRSFGDIEVNKFAENYFDGGGHKNAAGGHAIDSLENTLNKFRDLINQDVLRSK